jgi:hypothetical protein
MERIPSGWLLGSYHVMARIEILRVKLAVILQPQEISPMRCYLHSLSPQSMKLARNFNPTQKSPFVRG